MAPSLSRSVLWAVLAASAGVSAQGDLLSDRVSGPAAVQRLGADLEQVAERHWIAPDELRSALRDDPTLWLTEGNRLVYVDAAAPADDSPPAYSDLGPEDAFNLASNPGADKTIYMDFTGHQSVGNDWGHNITFPPYNTSGSSSSFSTGELNEIVTWWLYVVEDFAPFDVNVTTIEPPISDLVRSGGGDQRYGMRCVITQPTSGFGNGIGGVALLNSFNDNQDTPCFAFNKGNNTGSMTVTHEVGHTFGLFHDGLNSQEYHPGTQGWGPIMGAPFGSSLVQWSRGDYSGATTSQNDIQIMQNSQNGLNIIDDDHGDTTATATPVPPGVGCPVPTPGQVVGNIERRNDVDAFTFSTNGGSVTIDVDPTSPGGNVDIDLTLLDPSGAVVATDTPTNTQSASLSLDLAPGTYTVLVEGGEKAGVYSDYGSRGVYTISVDKSGDTIANLGGGVATGAGIVPSFLVSGTPCDGGSIAMSMFSAPLNSVASLIVGVTELSVPFKGGVLVPSPAAPGTVVAFPTGFIGFVQFQAPWPPGVPSGFEVFLQFWIPDANAVEGFAATDGVVITTP